MESQSERSPVASHHSFAHCRHRDLGWVPCDDSGPTAGAGPHPAAEFAKTCCTPTAAPTPRFFLDRPPLVHQAPPRVLSDACPIFGSRRKSYILIGSLAAWLAWCSLITATHSYKRAPHICLVANLAHGRHEHRARGLHGRSGPRDRRGRSADFAPQSRHAVLLIWLRDLLAVFWAPWAWNGPPWPAPQLLFSSCQRHGGSSGNPTGHEPRPAYCAIWAKSSVDGEGTDGLGRGRPRGTLLHSARLNTALSTCSRTRCISVLRAGVSCVPQRRRWHGGCGPLRLFAAVA